MSLSILQVDEGERQIILLALAELSLSRPGWDDALRRIAAQIDSPGLPLYENLKCANADRVQAERGPLMPLPGHGQ